MEIKIFDSQLVNNKKQAFTLMELLVVVLIVGIAYALFVINFPSRKDVKLNGFASLKIYLNKLSDNKDLTLRCYGDKCEQCVLLTKENKVIKSDLKLFKELPKVYDYDMYGYLEIKKYALNQCFEYKIFANGSSTHFLVEKEEQFYLFPAYFDEATIYSDYDEAVLVMDPAKNLPQDLADYYSER
jgi:prepilin-type N-terminal cleavage/methylation domain-containing protein